MYVCMYVRTYVCMYVCMYVCLLYDVCMYVCIVISYPYKSQSPVKNEKHSISIYSTSVYHIINIKLKNILRAI